MPEISIVIPTYRRPEWLRETLASCLRQTGMAEGAYEIVVVDNCPERSAEATVAAVSSGTTVPVTYVAEPRSGVSHARNAGVRASRGTSIAFIDDDELATDGWLAALLDAQRRFDADVVWGPVLGRVEGRRGANAAFAEAFYTRDLARPTGPLDRFCGTGNSLIRRSTCIDGPEPFDLRTNFTGGEDDLFFEALQRRGRRFVWAQDAAVYERVPEDRARYRHIWLRSFIKGQGPSMICALSRPADPFGVVRWMVIGTGQFVVYGIAAAVLWAAGSRRAPWMTARAIAGAGKVLWMRPFRPAYYGAVRNPSPGPLADAAKPGTATPGR